ncbi:MarR family winged helix-turn-helix transcriptional regulator [Halomonas sp. AOP12-C2-37]|uniref:MarR family winged helix-turn-helix transcriptional regulator n=1 Tax=unclassified Halomonas TaxID=2609666 RepID=UPI004033A408
MDHVDSILKQWQKERPDLDVVPMGTLGRIKRLNHYLMRAMEKTWSRYDLNGASFDVMATLRRAGAPYALSPGDLMASTMVTSGTMTHRINVLEKAGLIKRVKNPDDGRGFLISLSPQGLEVINEAVIAHIETQAQLVAALTDEQVVQLDNLLKQLLVGFEQQ